MDAPLPHSARFSAQTAYLSPPLAADKVPYQLEIFPDANNALLKTNGLAQQYYFMPQRIYLAKKQDRPQDFDFGMTVFKGLMTPEDTVGVNPGQTTGGGDVEVGWRILHLLDDVCHSAGRHPEVQPMR